MVLLGLLAAGAPACSTRKEPDHSPFSYGEVIDRIEPETGGGRRIDLRRCVGLWEPWAFARASLFKAIGERGVAGERQSVLLEMGSAGWPRYGYGLAVNGEVRPDFLDAVRATSRGGRISLGEVRELRSGVAAVEDGTCWFVSVWQDGRLLQAAWYGPIADEGEVSDVIRQMRPFLQELNLQ